MHATLSIPTETLLHSTTGSPAEELKVSPSTPLITISVQGAAAEHCRLARRLLERLPVMFDQVTLEIWNIDVSQSPVWPLYEVHWVIWPIPLETLLTTESRKTG